MTDDADHFTLFDREADVIQRLEQWPLRHRSADQACAGVEQGLLEPLDGAETELLGEMIDFNG
ncbi:MAG TPA: hypothetical protein PK724_04485 [Pseudomonadales bacterium]|nr:hypothetical protein [Pseudomonadales bacterium]